MFDISKLNLLTVADQGATHSGPHSARREREHRHVEAAWTHWVVHGLGLLGFE